jgi:hypothetical protein
MDLPNGFNMNLGGQAMNIAKFLSQQLSSGSHGGLPRGTLNPRAHGLR